MTRNPRIGREKALGAPAAPQRDPGSAGRGTSSGERGPEARALRVRPAPRREAAVAERGPVVREGGGAADEGEGLPRTQGFEVVEGAEASAAPGLQGLAQHVERSAEASVRERADELPVGADLPSDWLAADKPPFTQTGINFFDPFQVGRGRSSTK